MKRGGPPKRKTPLRNKAHMKRTGFVRTRSGRWKRVRQEGRVFGPLSDHVRVLPCQARVWCPEPCEGHTEACHARARGMGGGRGDWIREPAGAVVGNVFSACTAHHAWSDNHKDQCLLAMRTAAWQNGIDAIARGIKPVV